VTWTGSALNWPHVKLSLFPTVLERWPNNCPSFVCIHPDFCLQRSSQLMLLKCCFTRWKFNQAGIFTCGQFNAEPVQVTMTAFWLSLRIIQPWNQCAVGVVCVSNIMCPVLNSVHAKRQISVVTSIHTREI
jgi:hypothetical protein